MERDIAMVFDISVIIAAHNEGRLVHPTMRSVFRAIEYANDKEIKTEIIVILDKPDEKTEKYFDRYGNSEIKINRVDFADPGLSRNYGVHLSSSKYIAFLDADDLFGKNWLDAAYHEAEKHNDFCVYHVEYVIFFEAENIFTQCKGSEDKELNIGTMIEYNCWNSVHCLTQRELLIENKFISTPSDSGFGYEDWHWYCEIIAKGINVKVVPHTCVFHRKKFAGSRLEEHNCNNVVIKPSKLFEPAVFNSIINKENLKTGR